MNNKQENRYMILTYNILLTFFCNFVRNTRNYFIYKDLTPYKLITNRLQNYKLAKQALFRKLINIFRELNLKIMKGTNSMPANKGFFSKRRIDANQKQIVKVLEQVGCSVLSLADKGHGTPDLLVGFRGQNFLIEVKNGNGKLTEDQQKFFNLWKGQVMIVRDAEDVINFFAPRGQLANQPLLDFSNIK